MTASPVAGVYEKVVDRESAYEKLKGRAAVSPGVGGRRRRRRRPPAADSSTRSRTRSAAS